MLDARRGIRVVVKRLVLEQCLRELVELGELLGQQRDDFLVRGPDNLAYLVVGDLLRAV